MNILSNHVETITFISKGLIKKRYLKTNNRLIKECNEIIFFPKVIKLLTEWDDINFNNNIDPYIGEKIIEDYEQIIIYNIQKYPEFFRLKSKLYSLYSHNEFGYINHDLNDVKCVLNENELYYLETVISRIDAIYETLRELIYSSHYNKYINMMMKVINNVPVCNGHGFNGEEYEYTLTYRRSDMFVKDLNFLSKWKELLPNKKNRNLYSLSDIFKEYDIIHEKPLRTLNGFKEIAFEYDPFESIDETLQYNDIPEDTINTGCSIITPNNFPYEIYHSKRHKIQINDYVSWVDEPMYFICIKNKMYRLQVQFQSEQWSWDLQKQFHEKIKNSLVRDITTHSCYIYKYNDKSTYILLIRNR